MDIKLTNGRKIIIKDKKYYEANLAHFTRNGFFPVKDNPIKKATTKDISDKMCKIGFVILLFFYDYFSTIC